MATSACAQLWNRLWDRLYLDLFLYLWVRWNLFWRGGQRAVIIAGFPAVGKTTLARNAGQQPLPMPNGYAVVDMDSACYSHLASGERDPRFPRNYLQDVAARLFTNEILLVTTHEPVRKHLVAYRLWFTLAYPLPAAKANTLALLEARGDHQLAVLVGREFDNFVEQLQGQRGCEHRRLREGEFLAHVVEDVVRRFEARKR